MDLATKLDEARPYVRAALNYIIDTGEKPVTTSNAPGGPRKDAVTDNLIADKGR